MEEWLRMMKSKITTPRRANTGVVLMALILAFVGLDVAVFGADAEPKVKVTFVGFGPRLAVPRTDGSGMSVVLNLTNTSAIPFAYIRDGCLPVELGCFLSDSPTGKVVWRQEPGGPPCRAIELRPGEATNVSIFLPVDGRIGRVAVVQRLPTDFKLRWAECDQEIRCSYALQDGTVKPARLLHAPEKK
jgi:hypothetical protein